jgi:hypothetical protein
MTFAHTITGLSAKSAAAINARVARWLDRIAERQMRRAEFEMQMYRGGYRHSSKNDDELPIAR